MYLPSPFPELPVSISEAEEQKSAFLTHSPGELDALYRLRATALSAESIMLFTGAFASVRCDELSLGQAKTGRNHLYS